MKSWIVTFFVLASLVASTTSAANYYVSASGSDSNAGTNSVVPWKTIAKVNAMMATFSTKALAGNVTIYFNNADTWNFGASDAFKITCNGSPPYWITFDGETWGGNTPNVSKAKFLRTVTDSDFLVTITYGDGSYAQNAYIKFKGFELDGATINNAGIFQCKNASHVQLLNCKIHDTLLTGNSSSWAPAVFFGTSDSTKNIEINNLFVINNEIYGAGVHALAFYPDAPATAESGVGGTVGNITVQNNTIYNYGTQSTKGYGAGIQVMSCVGGDISWNTIYKSSVRSGDSGFGINFDPRNRRCANIDIHHNLIYGGPGVEMNYAFQNNNSTNINFYNNIIHDTVAGGISYAAGSSGKIFNNTIYNTGEIAIYVGASSGTTELRNNLVYLTNNVRALYGRSGITHHSNNLFYNTVAGRAVVDALSTAQWVSGWEPTGISANPLFMDTNSLPTYVSSTAGVSPDGLKPRAGSPAINAGTTGLGTTDIDLTSTPTGSYLDIGAYQSTAGGGETQIPAPPSRPRVVPDI